MTGTVIVGANQAGVQVAISLRELGDTAPITLVGAETHPPYQRPPLSKAFLSGATELAAMAFRSAAFYAEREITVVTGTRVTGLRLGPDGTAAGGAATTDHGELPFDRLALTVGARPRRLAVPGSDLPGVCYLRDADDAVHLRHRLRTASDVVVVGGGFIGLEAAAAARLAGCRVTVAEAAPRLLGRAVAPVVSDFYRQAHRRRGTEILLDAQVGELSGDAAGVRAVHLADGRVLPADLVLVGIGVQPRTELGAQIGVVRDGGIAVDGHGRTAVPGVVAAGDCTVFPHPSAPLGPVRLESVQNAIGQARSAAAALLGRDEPYVAVPWFWSDQFDLKLQIAGLSTGHDDHVVRGDPDLEKFSVLYYRGERLIACDAVNLPADYLVARRALERGLELPRAAVGDPTVSLKDVLAGAATSGR